ncbi:MAG: glycoside hydrolase family 3 N-terminal domain-containing protein [Phycisphaerae bacterium]
MTDPPAYRDPTVPVDDRVADLLGRMTIREKAGQLRQVLGFKCHGRIDGVPRLNDAFRKAMDDGVGALYGLARADAWTGVGLKTALLPREALMLAREIQRFVRDGTRLGIPLLLAEESPHGVMAAGTTMFPSPIGLASAWDEDLAARAAGVMSTELRAIGASIAYGPVLDLARDPRWSRVEETFGEDPLLASRLGAAAVRAMQGSPPKCLATLKHFAAYGETLGGHNGGTTHVGDRELHAVLLRAFQACVRQGAGSIMSSYNEIDGVPCSASRPLLTDTLRGQWGFGGFVVSDLYAIDGLVHQGVAQNLPEAAALALKAGVDMDLGGNAFGEPLLEALRRGLVTIADIDLAAGRVLRAKFTLGLFDAPTAGQEEPVEIAGCQSHRDVSLEAARKSIVLLQNSGVLPLKAGLRSIAVIGPNAHNLGNQLGDYTPPLAPQTATTVLEGVRGCAPPGVAIRYAKGCAVRDPSTASFAEAMAVARDSDMIIAVLGGSSDRNRGVEFTARGAGDAKPDSTLNDMDCGEGFDRCTLEPSGAQMDLLERLASLGKPLIVVLINGRPVVLGRMVEWAGAIAEAWYPGPQGGQAVAEVLFGLVNPSGKLPVSFPRTVGQLPVYYNHHPQARGKYVEMDGLPLLPFGFGLSYTRFDYADLRIAPSEGPVGTSLQVSVDVANAGNRDGDEIVQLYVRDVAGSVMTPVRQLLDFQRVHLAAGQRKRVTFTVRTDDLALLNQDLQWVVEPGSFDFSVGGDSQNVLTGRFELRA